jgi:hypothetical protein
VLVKALILRHAACRLRRRGHYLDAAKETRTCLSLRELSLLRSAPHSIVHAVAHKIPSISPLFYYRCHTHNTLSKHSS